MGFSVSSLKTEDFLRTRSEWRTASSSLAAMMSLAEIPSPISVWSR